MKGLIAVFAALAALLSGCNLNSSVKDAPYFAGRSALAAGAASLIGSMTGPGDGTVTIKAKEGDGNVRQIEQALAADLRAQGYAVNLVLPLSERQKGDKESAAGDPGRTFSLDFIPWKDANYGELAVYSGIERYGRLYVVKGASPAPVSNWVRRAGGE